MATAKVKNIRARGSRTACSPGSPLTTEMACGVKAKMAMTTATPARATTSATRCRKITPPRARTTAMIPMYLYSWNSGEPINHGKAVRYR